MIILKQKIFNETTSACAAFFVIIFILILFSSSTSAGENTDRLALCAKIDNDAARLQCFDTLTGRKKSVPEASPAITTSGLVDSAAPPHTERLSILTQQWDLDKAHRKRTFLLRSYRPNYFLPVAYNSSPNNDEQLDVGSAARAQHNEAKFQLSFKLKAWEDIFNQDIDLWIAYTQLSYWQLYNSAFSSPFRDTNYEPELLINFRTNYELLGFHGRFINVGVNHQSNGRSQPLSRSWNRIVANVGWERNNFTLLWKVWYKMPEDEDKDDNPDITKYMGYGELWGTYYWNKHKVALMFRNNLRSGNNFGAVQLDWSFPLPLFKGDWLKGYIQYFNGYGESLLDYYQSINRISAGIMLTDW
ncbi:MAG: phospholipase [Deltaproteobacteria bacterium HGW-Deltaproteobacteria-12]|jgi:phospholipase A1|nr:MAG: phospholipase [Deltaproteobacteria bacterium HGW-Deltaproteobacteria-12]